MKTYMTSTNIWPVCDVCTYWGPFEYDRLWDPEWERRGEGNLVCDDYDGSALKDAIVDSANRVFGEDVPLKEFGVLAVRVTNMGSPKEYNFCGDWLDFEVDVEDGFLDRALEVVFSADNAKRTLAYIADHFRSRDGFISQMPDCEAEIRDGVEQLKARPDGGELYEEYRLFGAVVALLWNCVEPRDPDGWLGAYTTRIVEDFNERHTLADFCTVMSDDEAAAKFPRYRELRQDMLKTAQDANEQVRKYIEADKPAGEAANERARKEFDGFREEMDEWRRRLRECVEGWMPDEECVGRELDRLAEEWKERWQ